MSEITPANGFEIKQPTEKLTGEQFKALLSGEFGLDGDSPDIRVQQLKQLSTDTVFNLMDSVNRSTQGSEASLETHDNAMRIGDQITISPEDRKRVLEGIVGVIKNAPDTIHPGRIGDVLALTVAMLHPFADGNGRTARVLGMAFRDEYDNPADFKEDFTTLSQSRDETRARGGFMPFGYMPAGMPETFNQSDPVQVGDYLASLLADDTKNPPYLAPYKPTPLNK